MKLTLMTLYNYTDGALFDNFQAPADMDRQNIIDSILDECGEFGVIYADADFMQMIIGVWCKRELPIWERLEKTLHYEYNPIENYDRVEDGSRHATGNGTNKETAFNSGTLAVTSGNESKGDEEYHNRIHGNIGVTTTQKMIEEQRNVEKFDMVGYIVASFRSRFSIDVYS